MVSREPHKTWEGFEMNLNRLMGVCLVLALVGCSSSDNGDGGTSTGGSTNGGSSTGGTSTGGGGDLVSACNGYCDKILSCDGAPTNGCGAACSDPNNYAPSGMNGCSNLTGLFNCLAGLPCSDFTGSGGTADIENCGVQNCH
jgi:hypothetical protein